MDTGLPVRRQSSQPQSTLPRQSSSQPRVDDDDTALTTNTDMFEKWRAASIDEIHAHLERTGYKGGVPGLGTLL
jgi:hypothetical protein